MLCNEEESDDYICDAETEVTMGECDELLVLRETTHNERVPVSVLPVDSRPHIQAGEEAADAKFLSTEVDDGNDDTAIDDDDDDEDDDYEMNELDSVAEGVSFPAHNKKSDKTRWCEREVRS